MGLLGVGRSRVPSLANTYLAWLANEDTSRQDQVRMYREYYEGDPPTQLTDRTATFLNIRRDKRCGMNVCATVVDATVERLGVQGFNAEAETDEVAEVVEELLSDTWSLNRMDASQDWVHRAALRDGEAFVIVTYDAEKGRPRFHHDFAYDGRSGCKLHIVPGTYDEIAFVTKRWIVEESGKMISRRMNIYYPDRVEKWQMRVGRETRASEAMWEPISPEGEEGVESVELLDPAGNPYIATVAWWTDTRTADGEPLGIPVVPFLNRPDGTGRGLSEIDNIIPVQDAINKIFIDLMAAADATGFGMYWTTSESPSGGWKVYPGAIFNLSNSTFESGSSAMGVLPAGDLSGLIDLMQAQIVYLAGISATPQSRFNPAAVRPAEGTQKQEESALVAKVNGLQCVWGNAWEDVMLLALRVANAFGDGVEIQDLDSLVLSCEWRDAEVRNELQFLQALQIKSQLGIPDEQLWREADYSPDQIEEFKQEKRRREATSRLLQARATAQQVIPVTPMPQPQQQETAQQQEARQPPPSAGI